MSLVVEQTRARGGLMRCILEDFEARHRPGPLTQAEIEAISRHLAGGFSFLALAAQLAGTNGTQVAAAPTSANPAPEDRWLTPEQAIAAHPTLTRRRLFRDNLPFVRHTSPRKIEISEQGLKKWIERNAGDHRASPPPRACRVR
jgi:hypothetical protein